jgi:hypothetical protein
LTTVTVTTSTAVVEVIPPASATVTTSGAATATVISGAPVFYAGSFEDSTTQASAGTAAANLVTMNRTSFSQGVSLVDGSKVTFTNAGTYLYSFLGQFAFTGGASNYNITVWIAKNGTIEANSAFTFTTTSAQASQILGNVKDIITLNAGDFLQFYWWSPAAGMALTPTATGSNPTRPASPSVNVNVFNVAG